jgi:ribosomal protein L33
MVPTNYITQSYVSIASTAGTGSLYTTAVNKHFHAKLVKIFKYIYIYDISQSSEMITAIKRKSRYTKAFFYALVVFLKKWA